MKTRKKKNKPQVYRHPNPKRYKPEFVIETLATPEAHFCQEFCAGSHEQKAIQMISVWVGYDGTKVLYMLCPSCAQTIEHSTSIGVTLLSQKIDQNLRAWLSQI